MIRPLRSSNCVSSINAMPSPMIIPPRNWLAAVRGFRMRPQSNDPSNRPTRSSPVTALTRTSQKIALCECIDQCINSSGIDPALVTDTLPRCARDRIEA